MILQRTMKTVFGSASRSGFYYFVMSNLPVRRASEIEAGLDVLGGVLVICLSGATISLMRFILTN